MRPRCSSSSSAAWPKSYFVVRRWLLLRFKSRSKSGPGAPPVSVLDLRCVTRFCAPRGEGTDCRTFHLAGPTVRRELVLRADSERIARLWEAGLRRVWMRFGCVALPGEAQWSAAGPSALDASDAVLHKRLLGAPRSFSGSWHVPLQAGHRRHSWSGRVTAPPAISSFPLVPVLFGSPEQPSYAPSSPANSMPPAHVVTPIPLLPAASNTPVHAPVSSADATEPASPTRLVSSAARSQALAHERAVAYAMSSAIKDVQARRGTLSQARGSLRAAPPSRIVDLAPFLQQEQQAAIAGLLSAAASSGRDTFLSLDRSPIAAALDAAPLRRCGRPSEPGLVAEVDSELRELRGDERLAAVDAVCMTALACARADAAGLVVDVTSAEGLCVEYAALLNAATSSLCGNASARIYCSDTTSRELVLLFRHRPDAALLMAQGIDDPAAMHRYAEFLAVSVFTTTAVAPAAMLAFLALAGGGGDAGGTLMGAHGARRMGSESALPEVLVSRRAALMASVGRLLLSWCACSGASALLALPWQDEGDSSSPTTGQLKLLLQALAADSGLRAAPPELLCALWVIFCGVGGWPAALQALIEGVVTPLYLAGCRCRLRSSQPALLRESAVRVVIDATAGVAQNRTDGLSPDQVEIAQLARAVAARCLGLGQALISRLAPPAEHHVLSPDAVALGELESLLAALPHGPLAVLQ